MRRTFPLTVPLFALSLLLLGAAAATAATATAAKTRAPAPAATARSATHPLLTVVPEAARPRLDTKSGWGGDAATLPPLPLSLVYADANETLLSRNVNRVLCASRAGHVTWVGTWMGAKRVDARAKNVRLFSRRDGLPGERVVAIAAEPDGTAWAVVPVAFPVIIGASTPAAAAAPLRLALCRFDPRTGRWATRQSVPVPPSGYYGDVFFGNTGYAQGYYDGYYEGGGAAYTAQPFGLVGFAANAPRETAFLVAARDFVCFAPGFVPSVSPAGAGGLWVWDKRRGALQTVALEAGLRADHPAVHVRFLRADDAGVWVGTNVGLLRWDRHGHAGPEQPAWRRFAPDRSLFAAAAVANSGGASPAGGMPLWVAGCSRPRTGPIGSPGRPADETPPDRWSLIRVSPTTGETTEFFAPATGNASLRRRRRRDEEFPAPVAMTVTTTGTIWVTVARRPGNGFDVNGRRWLDAVFYQLDPRTRRWTVLPAVAPTPPAARPHAAASTPPQNLKLSDLRAVPAEALQAAGLRALPAAYFSPAVPASLLPPPPPSASPYVRALPDSAGGGVWRINENGELTRSAAAGAATAAAGRFPVPAAQTTPVAQTLLLVARAAGSDSGNAVFTLTQDGVRRWNEATEKWHAVLPLDLFVTPSMREDGARLFCDANGRLIIATAQRALRLDPQTEQVSDLPRPATGPYWKLLGLRGKNGFWYQNGNYELVLVDGDRPAAAATAPLRVAPVLPAALRPNGPPYPLRAFAAAGDIAWYQVTVKQPGSEQDENGLLGYNAVTGAWTRFLPQTGGYSGTNVSFLNQKDDTYVAVPASSTASVLRYDAGADRWGVVSPPLPTFAQSDSRPVAALVSVDEAVVRLVDEVRLTVWEYDRRAGTWASYAAPAPAQTQRAGFEPDVIASGPDALFVATPEQGLWRFDWAAKTWRRVPIRRAETPRLIHLARDPATATRNDVLWALGTGQQNTALFVLRLRPDTREWRVWSDADGLPATTSSGGFSAWRLLLPAGPANPNGANAAPVVLGARTALRLNPQTDRWQDLGAKLSETLKAPVGILGAALDADGRRVWLLPGPAPREREQDWPGGAQTARVPLLAVYRGDDASPRPLPLPPDAPSSVEMNPARALCALPDALWVAAASGVYRWDKRAETWRKSAPVPFLVTRIERADPAGDALFFVSPDSVLRRRVAR